MGGGERDLPFPSFQEWHQCSQHLSVTLFYFLFEQRDLGLWCVSLARKYELGGQSWSQTEANSPG